MTLLPALPPALDALDADRGAAAADALMAALADAEIAIMTTGDTWDKTKLEGMRELFDIYHFLADKGVVAAFAVPGKVRLGDKVYRIAAVAGAGG